MGLLSKRLTIRQRPEILYRGQQGCSVREQPLHGVGGLLLRDLSVASMALGHQNRFAPSMSPTIRLLDPTVMPEFPASVAQAKK